MRNKKKDKLIKNKTNKLLQNKNKTHKTLNNKINKLNNKLKQK